MGGELRFFVLFLLLTINALAGTAVSLSPAVTEIIYYVGAQENLIADTVFCNYPNDARNKKKIGGIINPNIEKILSLKPDVIIATPLTPENIIKRLESFGFKLIILNLTTTENIAEAIEEIGNRFGKNGRKKRLNFINDLRQAEFELSRCLSGKKVIVLMSSSPLYTSGESTFIGEILKAANATNIAGEGNFFPISLEQLINRKPDIAIVAAKGRVKEELTGLLRRFKIRYVTVNPDNLLRPSPRIIQGIRELEEKTCK